MNFLVDAQLPPALSNWLKGRGYNALHVSELSLLNSTDVEIWNQAIRLNAILLTKDEDFADRVSRTSNGPMIVWLRLGNATNRALIAWLEPRWPAIVQLIGESNRLIEVR